MDLNYECAEQLQHIYRRMATEAKYRPEAPSDGFGHITKPLHELDLDAEARSFAHAHWEEEETLTYWAGCPGWSTRPAFVFLLKAAHLLSSATPDDDTGAMESSRRLIRMAWKELTQ